jgi:hypothetical protein
MRFDTDLETKLKFFSLENDYLDATLKVYLYILLHQHLNPIYGLQAKSKEYYFK